MSDPLELMKRIECADVAAAGEGGGLALGALPEWGQLYATLQAQRDELAQMNDHLHKMAREKTELRHEVKRLTDELSQTKKDVTDAELAWQSTEWWIERCKTWPEDIRQKLSLYDLRRMTGWRPPFEREAKEQS